MQIWHKTSRDNRTPPRQIQRSVLCYTQPLPWLINIWNFSRCLPPLLVRLSRSSSREEVLWNLARRSRTFWARLCTSYPFPLRLAVDIGAFRGSGTGLRESILKAEAQWGDRARNFGLYIWYIYHIYLSVYLSISICLSVHFIVQQLDPLLPWELP